MKQDFIEAKKLLRDIHELDRAILNLLIRARKFHAFVKEEQMGRPHYKFN